jgi:hypothetical protein
MAKILGHQVPVPDKITVLNCDLTETKPVGRRVDSVLLAEILVETGTDHIHAFRLPKSVRVERGGM